jgi:hypothetical protein
MFWSLYLHLPVTGWPSYTPRHVGATVKVYESAFTRGAKNYIESEIYKNSSVETGEKPRRTYRTVSAAPTEIRIECLSTEIPMLSLEIPS